MLGEAGVTYPAVHDPDGKTAAAYGARGTPTTILITRTGTGAGQQHRPGQPGGLPDDVVEGEDPASEAVGHSRLEDRVCR